MSDQQLFSRYPGIRSFTTKEAALFKGRSRETRELYSLIKVERFVVLFAKSGMGKTSLLNAGVMPLLQKDEYRAISIRFQNTSVTPLDMLFEAMKAKMAELKLDSMVEKRLRSWCGNRKASIWEYLKACSMVMNYLPATPILILDQFEEFFLHQEHEIDPFVKLMADIIFARVPKEIQNHLNSKENPTSRDEQWAQPLNIKLVMAIRSDRLSMLDNLSKKIPAILNNRYQIHPLNKRQASEAILLPAQSTDYEFHSPVFDYNDEALSQMINNLSNEKGEIESFQLQIICGHLEEQVIQKNLKEITAKHIGGAKGIQAILNNYYEDRVASIGSEAEQLLARKLVEEGLIVEGVRVSLAERIILSQYNIPVDLLLKLERTRIIKPEETHLGKAYEVSHDTLVKPILDSYNQRKALEERAIAEKERIEREKEQKRLAEEAEKERHRLEKEAEEQRQKAEIEANRRRRATMIAGVAVVMAVISVITSVWAFSAQKAATEATASANAALNEAKDQRQKAEDALIKFKATLAAKKGIEFKNLRDRATTILEAGGCPSDILSNMKGIAGEHPKTDSLLHYIGTILKPINAKCDWFKNNLDAPIVTTDNSTEKVIPETETEKEEPDQGLIDFQTLENRAETILDTGGCPEDILSEMEKIAKSHAKKKSMMKTIATLKEVNPSCGADNPERELDH